MINKAIEKITKEAMENGSKAFQVIEEHLTSICKDEKTAEKILAEDKTLKGAMKEMRSKAREMAKGSNSMCLTDEEGLEIVEEYFGITGTRKETPEEIDILDLL